MSPKRTVPVGDLGLAHEPAASGRAGLGRGDALGAGIAEETFALRQVTEEVTADILLSV